MSQHDYVIDNGTGSYVRSDINGALLAIATANSGDDAPSTTYAYQLWADTDSGNLKIRNGGNSAWIVVGALASANLGLMLASRFPNVNANITSSDEELNILDGVTSTAAELNLLDGRTSADFVTMTSIYPVGSVFTSVVATNPATLLAGMSGTTWVAFGSGRTLVGLDSGDPDFNAVEETGGAKTDNTTSGSHTLTTAQMPSHNHTTGSYTGLLKVDSNCTIANTDSTGGEPNLCSVENMVPQGGNAGHTHTNSHSIVQPYFVVYFWKRTA